VRPIEEHCASPGFAQGSRRQGGRNVEIGLPSELPNDAAGDAAISDRINAMLQAVRMVRCSLLSDEHTVL
jgi:hypothetical protein